MQEFKSAGGIEVTSAIEARTQDRQNWDADKKRSGGKEVMIFTMRNWFSDILPDMKRIRVLMLRSVEKSSNSDPELLLKMTTHPKIHP